jgi:DNA-binding SARP family transcriptional activator
VRLNLLSRIDETAARRLGTGKPFALLAFLVSAPGRATSRDHLVDLLWGDVERTAGRQALRQTLHYLRKRSSLDLIETDGDLLRAVPTVISDRDEFLSAIERQDWHTAIELHQAPFLAGFAAPGAVELERWAADERRRCLDLLLRACDALSGEMLTAEQPREALLIARRARAADPDSIIGWRMLLDALLANGDRIGASVEADALDRMLAESGRTLDPSTAALLRKARAVTPGASTDTADGQEPGTLVATLVGRTQVFSTIMESWARAQGRDGQHVHIVAPAGLGKTRLLDDVARRLASTTATCVRVRGAPGDQTIPFSFAASIAEQLAPLGRGATISPGSIGALLAMAPTTSQHFTGTVDSSVGEDAVRRRSMALSELLDTVARDHALVLMLDDVHWTDSASRTIVGALVGRLPGHAILVLSASRPPVPIAEAGHGTTLRALDPLSVGDVAEMVASIAALPEGAVGERLPDLLHSCSGGSPLLVLESLQHAIAEGVLARRDGDWVVPDLAALASVLGPGRAMSRRIASVGNQAHGVLLALTAVGAPEPASFLSDAVQRPLGEVESTLAHLSSMGLVHRDGDAWYLAHDEVGREVLALTDAVAVQNAHRRVAETLSSLPDPSGTNARRAAANARAANDDALLERVIRERVSRARDSGDGRSSEAIVGEALGALATKSQVHTLAESLPISAHFRARWLTARAAALLAVAGAGFGLAAFVLRTPPARPTHRAVLMTASGAHSLALDTTRLDAGTLLAIAKTPTAESPVPGARQALMQCEPDGPWLGFAGSDSGTSRLLVQRRNTPVREMLATTSADPSAAWLPGCESIAVVTDRWDSTSGRADLALVRMSAGTVVPLTRTSGARESSPIAGANAASILFVRTFFDAPRPSEVCSIGTDGRNERCTALRGYDVKRLHAAVDGGVLATAADSAGLTHLVTVELARGVTTVLHSGATLYAPSPDGAIVLFDDPVATGTLPRWRIARRARMDLGAPLALGADEMQALDIVWQAQPLRTVSLMAVRAMSPDGPMPMNTPIHLDATGVDASGQFVRLSEPRFRALTTGATVDSMGVVIGTRAGRVLVEISNAGMLADTAEIVFGTAAGAGRPIADFAWASPTAWQLLGGSAPQASVGAEGSLLTLTGARRTALHMQSKATASARGGAGAELLVAMPITAMQWQRLTLALATGDRSVQRTAAARCALEMPSEDGAPGWRRVGIVAGSARERVLPTPPGLADGTWHRVRIQVFPDGACGIAVDGQPLWISRARIDRAAPLWLDVEAVTEGTAARIRDVSVWEGVRAGVPWSRTAPTVETADVVR